MSDTQAGLNDVMVRSRGLLNSSAQALFKRDLTPLAFVGRLLAHGHHDDALVFTANVLPVRDAVWWGCLCAWKNVRPEPSEKEAEAFRAALRWLQKPDEQTRRAAQAAAALATLDTPAGCIALAIFLSGGSISKPNLPPVQPPPDLTARTIVNALRLAAALKGDGPPAAVYHRYVLLARQPLLRLTAAALKVDRDSGEGSIASRWSDHEAPAPPPSASQRSGDRADAEGTSHLQE